MARTLQLAAGSVIGRDHQASLINCQDSYRILQRPEATIAVVCDGVGDRERTIASEFGARLGSVLLPEILYSVISHYGLTNPGTSMTNFVEDSGLWERVRHDVLAEYRQLALKFGSSLSRSIAGYLMHTIVGVLITHDWTVFFHIGDGIIYLNGERHELGPFPNNTPTCLAQGILDPSDPSLRFQVPLLVPTDAVDSFLIATDGLKDLEACQEEFLPRKKEPIGPVSQFWENDRMFAPYGLQKRLALINQPVTTVQLVYDPKRPKKMIGADLEKRVPPLGDDTTLVVGRFLEQGETASQTAE